jgi:TetR/AcrR family transcriptional repressor of nem operon
MTTSTKDTIMTVARAMVQAHGYNSLSFRDLAAAVGVKSSSIHYHFPTKDDLGAQLAHQYTDEFLAYLEEQYAASQNWATAVNSYIEVFRNTLLRENRMCLGGILAAERPQLAPQVGKEIERYTATLVEWLTHMVRLADPKLEMKAAQRRGYAIFAAVEGAQLVARGCVDVNVFDDIVASYRSAGLLPPA